MPQISTGGTGGNVGLKEEENGYLIWDRLSLRQLQEHPVGCAS